MKNLFLVAVTMMTISGTTMANTIHCADTALNITSYAEKQGWGAVNSEPLKVISSTNMAGTNFEEFKIASTVSGSIYKVQMYYDERSENCELNSLTMGF